MRIILPDMLGGHVCLRFGVGNALRYEGRVAFIAEQPPIINLHNANDNH